ncbi:hypothetical protein [Streptomyces sp. CC219B]|nr:hypothetical protein [Streptomyces sp. CC219B]
MIPPATGLRTPWDQLPEALRTAVTDVLGAPVVQGAVRAAWS